MLDLTAKQWALYDKMTRGELARINLLEGSVSGGKTFVSLVIWALWVAKMPRGGLYMMCAKSLTTLKRNCLIPMQELVGERSFSFSMPAKEGRLFGRRVLLEGANDARSESKIRGLTLQGAYCDELTQFPEDFFAMLLSRLRVPGAKLIATTNPDSPGHWLKREYIDRAGELDFLDVRFTMEDNTMLDPAYAAALRREYTGVFYDRFILGEWVNAEGLVYQDAFSQECVTDAVLSGSDAGECAWYVSIDYGTMNPFCAILWRVDEACAVAAREYYYDGRKERRQKTDEEYYEDLRRFIGDADIERIVIDPSAASMIQSIRKHGEFTVMKADNDVLNGIRRTAALLKGGRVKIFSGCVNLIREFGLYSWDRDANEDRVVKENDHGMDAIRYMVNTVLRHRYRAREDDSALFL